MARPARLLHRRIGDRDAFFRLRGRRRRGGSRRRLLRRLRSSTISTGQKDECD